MLARAAPAVRRSARVPVSRVRLILLVWGTSPFPSPGPLPGARRRQRRCALLSEVRGRAVADAHFPIRRDGSALFNLSGVLAATAVSLQPAFATLPQTRHVPPTRRSTRRTIRGARLAGSGPDRAPRRRPQPHGLQV